KRLVDKAKKEQVPSDIINRAIDKVNSGVDETYTQTTYELFGPAGSTLIVDCLTDNVNRSVSSIRAVVNKCHIKMGAQGSVNYMYDHLAIISFKGLSEDETLEALIESGVDVSDIETENDEVIVYGSPSDLFNIKEAVIKAKSDVVFDMDEITYIAKDKVTLTGEDLDIFQKTLNMLDEVEDVQNVYHNVEL
ncbi:MAG: YebC/PmpR family DNA-binding transcriptional regulator, partial [Bacilli bacterium]|nr:YebC/PmpR family DNA-binding transcriptional regulator [Bacilli bacterium]